MPKCDGEHGLADTGWADEQDVAAVVDEPQGGEVAEQFVGDGRLGVGVEVVDPPVGG